MLTKTISLYTELEKTFIESAMALLKMKYISSADNSGTKHTTYIITGNIKQFELLTQLIEYNYTENVIK